MTDGDGVAKNIDAPTPSTTPSSLSSSSSKEMMVVSGENDDDSSIKKEVIVAVEVDGGGVNDINENGGGTIENVEKDEQEEEVAEEIGDDNKESLLVENGGEGRGETNVSVTREDEDGEEPQQEPQQQQREGVEEEEKETVEDSVNGTIAEKGEEEGITNKDVEENGAHIEEGNESVKEETQEDSKEKPEEEFKISTAMEADTTPVDMDDLYNNELFTMSASEWMISERWAEAGINTEPPPPPPRKFQDDRTEEERHCGLVAECIERLRTESSRDVIIETLSSLRSSMKLHPKITASFLISSERLKPLPSISSPSSSSYCPSSPSSSSARSSSIQSSTHSYTPSSSHHPSPPVSPSSSNFPSSPLSPPTPPPPSSSSTNTTSMHTCSAIRSIIGAMCLHESDPRVQSEGCAVICNLASCHLGRMAIATEGDGGGESDDKKRKRMKRKGRKKRMGGRRRKKVIVGPNGDFLEEEEVEGDGSIVVDVIMDALLKHGTDDSDVAFSALACLSNLAKHASVREAIVSRNGVEIVGMVLGRHEEKVRKRGEMALEALTASDAKTKKNGGATAFNVVTPPRGVPREVKGLKNISEEEATSKQAVNANEFPPIPNLGAPVALEPVNPPATSPDVTKTAAAGNVFEDKDKKKEESPKQRTVTLDDGSRIKIPIQQSMEMNVAYEALEKMRKLNLEVEFGDGCGASSIDVNTCTECLRRNQSINNNQDVHYATDTEDYEDDDASLGGQSTSSTASTPLQRPPTPPIQSIPKPRPRRLRLPLANLVSSLSPRNNSPTPPPLPPHPHQQLPKPRSFRRKLPTLPKTKLLRPITINNHPPPCLTCGSPTCPRHNSASTPLLQSILPSTTVRICTRCSYLFTIEFILDCVSTEDKVRKEAIHHMMDVYDRTLLVLRYSCQFIDDVMEALRKQGVRGNRIGLGSSGAGIVSGTLGVAAAATILTPAGPPLLIASLLFGGSATAASTTSEAVNYFAEPTKLADKIIALHSMIHSLLQVTNVLRDAMVLDHIRIDDFKDASNNNNNPDDTDESSYQETVQTLSSKLSSEAEPNPLKMSLNTSTASAAYATAGMEITALTATSTTLKNSRFLARTATNSLRAARVARFAGGALSAATIVLDAKEARDTIRRMRDGEFVGGEKCEVLQKVKEGMEEVPGTDDLAGECEKYLEVMAERRRRREEEEEKEEKKN